MVFGILNISTACAVAGAIVGVCEGVSRAALGVICERAKQEKVQHLERVWALQALLEKLQLTAETSTTEPVSKACVDHCLHDERDTGAIVTLIDLVFVVAIKRASKAAAWATQYARLCASLKTAAQPLCLDETVQDALYGRSTQEYCRMSFRTVTVDAFGRIKPADRVTEDAAELRGSLRFMACLFKEHLLPIHFVHALVLELLAHAQAAAAGTVQGQAPLHSQSMLAVGLVSVLQCCAEMYVSSEQLGSEDMMGPAGAEGHIRTISLILLRLQSKIDDPFDDLKADLQDLQFKLSSYSSSMFGGWPQHHHHHHTGPRRSEDVLGANHRKAAHAFGM